MSKKRIIACIVAVVVLAATIASIFVILQHMTYTVNFYSDTNKLIKIETVKRGTAAEPPNEPSLTEGRIFTKWDRDFSKVKKNMDVLPEFEEYTGKENVIAMAGAYGKKGEEVFIPLRLCGDVNLTGLDIIIEYDANALELVSVYNVDGAVVYNADEKGKVRMNYISAENTEDEVDLCNLKFKIKAVSDNTQVKTSVEKIVSWNSEEKLIEPSYTLIDASVFVIA